jgi:phospholipid transport system substrate-binding protein
MSIQSASFLYRGLGTVIIIAAFCLSPAAASAPACKDTVKPKELLSQLSDSVIESFNDRLVSIKNNPAIAAEVIEEVLLPRVDVEYASEKVLAFKWEDLSTEERSKFEDAFSTFLVRHSSVVIADYMTKHNKELSGDIFRYRGQRFTRDKRAVVRSKLVIGGQQVRNVFYKLYCGNDSWKIYDIQMDGVSIITQWENQFKSQIEKDGFKGLIRFLNAKNDTMLALLRDKDG